MKAVGNHHAQRDCNDQRLASVEHPLQPDHPPEFLPRHPHRSKHGEFRGTQLHVGGDGVEDVCDADQRHHCDEAVEKNSHHKIHAPICPIDCVIIGHGTVPELYIVADGRLQSVRVLAFDIDFHIVKF